MAWCPDCKEDTVDEDSGFCCLCGDYCFGGSDDDDYSDYDDYEDYYEDEDYEYDYDDDSWMDDDDDY